MCKSLLLGLPDIGAMMFILYNWDCMSFWDGVLSVTNIIGVMLLKCMIVFNKQSRMYYRAVSFFGFYVIVRYISPLVQGTTTQMWFILYMCIYFLGNVVCC